MNAFACGVSRTQADLPAPALLQAFPRKVKRVSLKLLRMLAVFGVCGLLWRTEGYAQSVQGAADEDLRARQAELFEQMSEEPANLELMFEYALTALRLEDNEAAISTLERMLFFNPNLSRVKLELAVAYYRLGVYDVSRLHFESVLADDPPPEVVARIQPFLTAIEKRTAVHGFSGYIAVGGIYSSNATLGPPDREVQAEFFPGGVALISNDSDEAPDFGVRATALLNHRYDLQRPNDDAWVSSAEYTGVRYNEESAGELDAIFLKTGPFLALDDEAYGLKGRPYGGVGYVRSAGESLYLQYGGGMELSESLSPTLAVFGLASLEWRDFLGDRDDFDGLYGAGAAGVAITPRRGRTIRAAALLRTDRAQEDFTSNYESGLRLSASEEVDVGAALGLEFFERPWRFSLSGQVSYRFFDGPDPAIDADNTREDIDARLAGRIIAPIGGSTAISADVSYFERFSNIQNFDLKNMEVGVSLIQFF